MQQQQPYKVNKVDITPVTWMLDQQDHTVIVYVQSFKCKSENQVYVMTSPQKLDKPTKHTNTQQSLQYSGKYECRKHIF